MTAPSPSQGVSALTVLVGLALKGHRISSSHHWVTILDQDLHLLCRLWVLSVVRFLSGDVSSTLDHGSPA